MARPSTVWFREHDGYYYTTVRGKRVRLAKDKKEADKAFHALLAAAPDDGPVGFRPTFRRLADLYLDFTQQTKSPRTYEHQLRFLQSFCDSVGVKRAADLKPGDVTAWLLKHKTTWGHNTQVTARSLVVACLNWAVREGHVPSSPLRGMKVGQTHGRERILTKDERTRVLAAISHNRTFELFLRFLELTGCRPYSEAAQITADMIDWQAGNVPLAKHKNARLGKRRVIYLTDAAKAVLRELSDLRPDGPLFRTRHGVPYNRSNIIKAFRRLEAKLNIPRFNPYAYRHTYITEALERGLTADIVAELCGNTPAMVTKYYSHLEAKKDTLREAAKRAVG